MSNPRYSNGNLRRKYRARLKSIGAACGICSGRLGPIHYDEPSDSAHPLSFVIDEIRPVSRWRNILVADPQIRSVFSPILGDPVGALCKNKTEMKSIGFCREPTAE